MSLTAAAHGAPAADQASASADQEGFDGDQPSASTGESGRWARLRLHHLTLALFAAALVATLTNDPGAYVADARFEHAWAGQAFLDRHRELWDPVRTLGRPTQFFSPVVGTLVAVADVLGLPAPLTQRLLHALYLVVAGVGAVLVLRLFRPRLAAEHAVCGLLFMFNPYTTQFLLPSGLFLHYALAPWFVVAIIRGARAPTERWRWAGVFALAVFALGALNTASLLYALLPIVPVALYEVAVARELRARDLAAVGWRAALLAGSASTAAVMVLLGSSAIVAENLATTELPRTVATHSSWTESWRGLGSWLTYFFRPGGTPLRPEAMPYLFQPVVVASTFVAPIVALSVLWRSTWRPRLCFGMLAVTGAVVLVGLHPPADPPPLGSTLASAMDDHLMVRSFRNTYKAGAVLMLGLAPLVAVGTADALRALRASRPRWSRTRYLMITDASRLSALVIGGPLALALVVASFPFWSANLYPTHDRMTDVPGYWREATAWLDGHEGAGSVLVLPGVNRARYRWGYPGDDLFDALLTRQHGVRSSLSQGTPEIADLLAALDDRVVSGTYEPGTISRLAQLIGVRWVVVRNDLAWEELGLPRPAELEEIRSDPSLRLVRTFGLPGEHVVAIDDTSAAAERERHLPPVEVFDTGVDGSAAVLVPPGPPLLVSGDGDGLVSLAARGMIDGSRSTSLTGRLDAGALSEALEQGAPLAITDSNRRRVERVTTARTVASETLPADARPRQRPPRILFETPGVESVATFGDAREISASSYGTLLAPNAPWARPANAFDGIASSWWVTGEGVTDPRGSWVRAELREPTAVQRLTIEPAPAATGGRYPSLVTILLDGQPVWRSRLMAGLPSPVELPEPLVAEEITVRIDEIAGSGTNAVGLADVRIEGVDARERIQLPDDVARRAEGDDRLANLLARAPIAYAMTRQSGPPIREAGLARRFRLFGPRTLEVTGVMHAGEGTTPAARDLLAVVPVGECFELLALDGRPVAVRLTDDPFAPDGAAFEGCEPVPLDDGWHDVVTLPGAEGAVDALVLATAGASFTRHGHEPRPVGGFSRAGGTAEIDAAEGGTLLFRQGYGPGWSARIDGRTVAARPGATVNAWDIAPGVHRVTIEYRPQRVYELAVAVSFVAVAIAAVLALHGPARASRERAR